METFKEEHETGDLESDAFSNADLSCSSSPQKSDCAQSLKFAEKEARSVSRSRLILIAVLVGVAAAVCTGVYLYSVSQEEELFEQSFNELGLKVVDTFKLNAARRLGTIETFAFSMTSNAIALNQTWPNVVVPDFERKMAYTLELAALVSVAFIPFVTGIERKSFEAFAVENQGWLAEGLEIQGNITGGVDESNDIAILEKTWGQRTNGTIREEIFRITATGIEEETGDGPYAPFWQIAPALPTPGVMLYNAMSHPSRLPKLQGIIESGIPLVSEAWDIADTEDPSTVGKKAGLQLQLNRRPDLALNYQDGPVSDVYVPVFEKVDYGDKNNKVVATLTSYVYWQIYFYNILPPGSGDLMAILENSCNQSYSYTVNGHDDVNYIGQGDLHDTKYDDMVVSTGWNAFLQLPDDVVKAQAKHSGHCVYQVRVYPTQDLEDRYLTQTPLYFVLVLIFAFVLTSMVFILYDCMVEKRNRVVTQKAVQSTEVVNSLYPAAVRERLFEDENKKKAKESALVKNVWTSSAQQIMEDDADDSGLVADFYESSTIMFADLAGFTKWSSARQPKDVFHLLEALYGAFDMIANRRRVFKVETIGDCYLAICGCPTPNDKHALTMSKFASECMAKMDQVIQCTLIDKLGQETANLQFRVGLHSGPVTAGVLRGDRARFQLFGDTVNTASRMESNGIPGRIQASESTAELIRAGGKGEWLTEREEGVEAKGKGRLRTFFVEVSRPSARSSARHSTVSSDTGTPDDPSERLVEEGHLLSVVPTAGTPSTEFDLVVDV